MTTTKPYGWISSLSESLMDMGKLPLWGSPPPFPWQEATASLKESLSLDQLSLRLLKADLLSKERLLEGMGSEPFILPVQLSPLPHVLFFVLPQLNVRLLSSLCLSTTPAPDTTFSDSRFIEGFYRFIVLNALYSLNEKKAFGDLTATLAEPAPFPSDPCLCVDLQIQAEGHSCAGRLVCPAPFQQAFKQHFATKRVDLTSPELSPIVDLTLRLECGGVTLSQKQFSDLLVGDLLLLDHCTLDPITSKGTLEIVLGRRPIFQARIRENQIKILDYSFYNEESKEMDTTASPNPATPPPEQPTSKVNPEEELPQEETESDEHLWVADNEKPPSPQELVKAEEIPLTLTAEIGRLDISLAKLLELQPGATLDLKTRPEDGVSITINGKRVAKAELIKIGEALGLKILQIGK